MSLVEVDLSTNLEDSVIANLAERLTELLARITGKSRRLVCVAIRYNPHIFYGGSLAPCAFAHVTYGASLINFNTAVTRALADTLREVAHIPKDRFFIIFHRKGE